MTAALRMADSANLMRRQEIHLTLKALQVRAVEIPLEQPIPTALGVIRSTPLVLLDVVTAEGVTGSAYLFVYTPMALAPLVQFIRAIEPALIGARTDPGANVEQVAAHFRLLGRRGLVGLGLALLDMALWDAHARALGGSLAAALGASTAGPTPTYASLVGWAPAELERSANEAIKQGFTAFKIKIGQERLEDDLDAVRRVRSAVGHAAPLMVDYNQSLTLSEARLRAKALDDMGVTWIEEPVLSDDFIGHAEVARLTQTPVQTGENYEGPDVLAASLAAGASDLVMLDVMKIGGVTGWMKAAALADAAARPVSSHIFIEFSSQLLAATISSLLRPTS